MRPVDADVLIPLIQEDKIEGKILDIVKALGDGPQAETLNQACDRHIKIINSLPTINVAPIKHGEWIRKSLTAWMWTCSCCKKDDAYAYSAGESFEPDVLQDLFCPNCGADMRERKDDEHTN